MKRELNGITGFVGFAMSFGGKWFGGYRRDKKDTINCIENMKIQTNRSKKSAINQSKKLQGVQFVSKSYIDLDIPPNSLIYCDPPYMNTTEYDSKFDSVVFWDWCREKIKDGHKLFVSEYNAPNDFDCVWQNEIPNTISNTKSHVSSEKLFVHKTQPIEYKFFDYGTSKNI